MSTTTTQTASLVSSAEGSQLLGRRYFGLGVVLLVGATEDQPQGATIVDGRTRSGVDDNMKGNGRGEKRVFV